MQLKRSIIFITLVLPLSIQGEIYECPTNNEFVNAGDTVSAVVAKCGNPKETLKGIKQTQPKIEEWGYVVMRQARDHRQKLESVTFRVVFENNQVKNIESSPFAPDFFRCRFGTISVGNTKENVINACGAPLSKNVIPQEQNEEEKINTTQLIYQSEAYFPRITFIFENGKLVGKE